MGRSKKFEKSKEISPDIVALKNQLEMQGFRVLANERCLKVGVVTYWPTSGTFNCDNQKKRPEIGFEAYVAYLRELGYATRPSSKISQVAVGQVNTAAPRRVNNSTSSEWAERARRDMQKPDFDFFR